MESDKNKAGKGTRGRPKTDAFWLEQVKTARSLDPSIRPKGLAIAFREVAETLGRKDAPSEQTVRRLLTQIQEPVNKRYQEAFWPESFGEFGPLPWEAGSAFLELLRFYNDPDEGGWVKGYWDALWPWRQPRPDIKTTLWFYRVTQAAPQIPVSDRLMAALALALDPANRAVEYQLAEVPFSQVKAFAAINEAAARLSSEELEEKATEDLSALFVGLAPPVEEALLESILGTNPPMGEDLTVEAVADRLKLRRRLSGIEGWNEDFEEFKGLDEEERFRYAAKRLIDIFHAQMNDHRSASLQ